MLCYKRYTCYAYYTCSTHLTHKVHVIHVTDVRHVHDTQVANVAQAYKQVRPTCIILIRRVILLKLKHLDDVAGTRAGRRRRCRKTFSLCLEMVSIYLFK